MKKNVRNMNKKLEEINKIHATKQCEFKDLKKITRLQIIDVTSDFNWLKDV